MSLTVLMNPNLNATRLVNLKEKKDQLTGDMQIYWNHYLSYRMKALFYSLAGGCQTMVLTMCSDVTDS